MNETTTPETTTETAAPTATPKTKKTPMKKTTKPAAKKTPMKKTEGQPGLRKPQQRILKALAKNKSPLTRTQVSEKAPVDLAACVEYIGSHDPAVRTTNDKKHFPSLISLGLVKFGPPKDESSGVCYELTAKGRTEAAKI